MIIKPTSEFGLWGAKTKASVKVKQGLKDDRLLRLTLWTWHPDTSNQHAEKHSGPNKHHKKHNPCSLCWVKKKSSYKWRSPSSLTLPINYRSYPGDLIWFCVAVERFRDVQHLSKYYAEWNTGDTGSQCCSQINQTPLSTPSEQNGPFLFSWYLCVWCTSTKTLLF